MSFLDFTEALRTPRYLMRPAPILAMFLAVLLAVMVWLPWQQSAFGEGSVVPYAPTDREQGVDAPVTGRIASWEVREGQFVREGETLLELIDLDPMYVSRLGEKKGAIETQIDATEQQALAYEERARAQEKARRMKNEAAARQVEMAQQRTLAAAQRVHAARMAVETAQRNFTRTEQLQQDGLSSIRELELASLKVTEMETSLASREAGLKEAEAAENAAFAEQLRVDAEALSSVSSAWADAKKAAAEIAKAQIERAKIDVKIARQKSQRITAPVDGTIVWLNHQRGGGVVTTGERLALIVPSKARLAVQLMVDGNDAPLVQPGREVRLQFEGWPALQFSGWPQVAVGTFEGRVLFADPILRTDGKLRVVIEPGENSSWPSRESLPLGTQVRGWILLDEVSVGYELWRQLNGFPPTLESAQTKDKAKPVQGGMPGVSTPSPSKPQ